MAVSIEYDDGRVVEVKEITRGVCSFVEKCEGGRTVWEGRRHLVDSMCDLRYDIPIPDEMSLIQAVSYDEKGNVLSQLHDGSGEINVMYCDGEHYTFACDEGCVLSQRKVSDDPAH